MSNQPMNAGYHATQHGGRAINTPQAPPPQWTPPVAQYLQTGPKPGDAGLYLVMPITLMTNMPPEWQERMAYLLNEFHGATSRAPWPDYRVHAVRRAAVSSCNETQLAKIGITADYDDDGVLVYQDAKGPIADPDHRFVFVESEDPLYPTPAAQPRG